MSAAAGTRGQGTGEDTGGTTAGPPPHAPVQDAGAMPVLLVEDDDADALLVEELLLDSGVEVELTRAASLAEALEALRCGAAPRCVLLDLHLPDIQGMGIVERVLEAAPGVAVVVLTGLAEESAGLEAVAAGAQDYLSKGWFEPSVLGRAIRYAVQRREIERASAALQTGLLRAQENARLERGLLPSPLLRSGGVRVVARYRPGREQALLGGDFYDVVETPDGSVHAVVGDVSGHGPDEAALGVCLRVAWRSLTLVGTRGPEAVRVLQELLCAERASDEIFATVTTLELPPGRDVARVVRAGHPPLLLRGPHGAARLVETAHGPALGLLPGVPDLWTQDVLDLPPEGALALFTDGLFEGRAGPEGARLGEAGLLELARAQGALPGPEFVDGLIGEARRLFAAHGGHGDDVAVVHLEWSPRA